MQPRSGQWFEAVDYGQPCQVVEALELWDSTVFRVWLPESDSIVRIDGGELVPIDQVPEATSTSLSYAIAAARVAEALTQDVLLAPI